MVIFRGVVIFGEFVYILASLRGSSLCLYSGCFGGMVIFREFAYILASLRGSSLCLYSGCYGGVLSSENLSISCTVISWRCCGAAAFVYILAAVEEFYLLIICLYSGVETGQQSLSIFWLLWRSFIFREFVYILASLRGSSLGLYSGCGGDLSSESLSIFCRR